MNNKWILAAICSVMLFSLAPAQQHPTPTPTQTMTATGRYQFESLVIDELDPGTEAASPAHVAFLVDTETGQIWRFQPNWVQTQNGKSSVIPDMLIRVDRTLPHAQ
jgi:hypothetical protein